MAHWGCPSTDERRGLFPPLIRTPGGVECGWLQRRVLAADPLIRVGFFMPTSTITLTKICSGAGCASARNVYSICWHPCWRVRIGKVVEDGKQRKNILRVSRTLRVQRLRWSHLPPQPPLPRIQPQKRRTEHPLWRVLGALLRSLDNHPRSARKHRPEAFRPRAHGHAGRQRGRGLGSACADWAH